MSIKSAKWITSDAYQKHQSFSFIKELKLEGAPEKVYLDISAKGLYLVYIDSMLVSDSLFAPGWTSYSNRVQYETLDIGDYLRGKPCSTLEIKLAEGWCCGRMGWKDEVDNKFAPQPALRASLKLKYGNSYIDIDTDESWNAFTNEITFSSIYDGESIDFNRIREPFGKTVIDDSPFGELVPWEGEKIIEHTSVPAKEIIRTPAGELVVDFGQNLTGYVRLHLRGRRGQTVTISHAEVLDSKGNFFTQNLRSARAQMQYTLSGSNPRTLCPRFTFMGFRYIKIEGYDGPLQLKDLCAVPVYSDIKRTGYFGCGRPLVNRLFENVIWGQRSNFLDIPTDCPQRDERLGWTGDAQVFIKAASYNYDVLKFFKKWLHDLALDQREDGSVTNIVPNIPGLTDTKKSAAWGDAATVCPWQLYLTYGDKEVLSDQFESMRRWVEYIRATGDNELLWQGELSKEHFGDWLALDVEGDNRGATPHKYVANAYYVRSLSLLIKAGHVLGKDMNEYEQLFDRVLAAVRERLLDENGMPKPNTQTAYALGLKFGLIAENDRKEAADKLVSLIAERNYSLTTGFVGTPLLLHALSENGKDNIAYRLLLREEYPSWLYCVRRGATTIWEHWDGIDTAGRIKHLSMTSFNHYAFGAVADFLYEKVCGINICEDAPGFDRVVISPHVHKQLGYATATIITRHGELTSAWSYDSDSDGFEFLVTVPKGVSAVFDAYGVSQALNEGTNKIKIKVR